MPFLSVNGDSLVVTALKKADKGDGIVLRMFEETGQHPDTTVHFLGQEQSFHRVNLLEERNMPTADKTLNVAPYQINTVELPGPAH